MPLTGFRDRIRSLAPGFLREGVGERLMYVFGLELDAVMERAYQGVAARFPLITRRRTGARTPAPDSALLLIGNDRGIERGLTEPSLSYATRLQRAFGTWQIAGTPRSMLSQMLGYLLEYRPRIRHVSSAYTPDPARNVWRTAMGLPSGPSSASYPPSLLYSTWQTYEAGADSAGSPTTARGTPGGIGEWNWDSASQVSGSWSWWGSFVILYATGAEQWTTQPTWFLSATSPYTLGNAPGSLGLSATWEVVESIRRIAKQWKTGNEWVRWIIVSFDDALFDPTQNVGSGVNPNGFCGRWCRVAARAYVPARPADAAYCDGVI